MDLPPLTQSPEQLYSASSPGLDEILGERFPVLNDGFVSVIDYMGNDAAIVQAARVSYGAGTKHVSEDRTLIRFLMRHRHTTPFEMCELKLLVRVPMDCWRQWIRHRTASVNEYSTRYSEAIDSMQKTDPSDWRLQSKKNKQRSAEAVIEWPDGQMPYGVADGESAGEYLSKQESGLHAVLEQVYQDRLKFGVAREQARKDLPLSNYTEAYWKMDLHNLFHFLSLRMDSHAQLEIRSYANAIAKIVKVWVPDAWAAFEDYRLNATFLTALDISMLNAIARESRPLETAEKLGWLNKDGAGELKPNRERAEFEAKADRLDVTVPWPRS